MIFMVVTIIANIIIIVITNIITAAIIRNIIITLYLYNQYDDYTPYHLRTQC